MRDLYARFETWLKQTYRTAPTLARLDDFEYEDTVLQKMFIAYRAGFNRCNKERAEMYELVRREEREACINIIETYPLSIRNPVEALIHIRQIIRARGQA